jgi:hypothetical protein
MTKLLSIAPRPDALIACDMSSAPDTPSQRLAEYRRLFESALTGRESTPTATTFRFAALPGVREWVCDLVNREAACCPFLSYEIDQEGDEIVWTTSGGLGASDMGILDEFLDGSESLAGSSDAIAQQLEDQGLHVIVPNTERRPALATRLAAEGGKTPQILPTSKANTALSE